ncbi:hypothetical protein ABQJ54_03195 [Rhodanobacter sp. Si-c]|uniref:Uncharacterized protein n=1 Tax=Rhodanobacter lycopersici TaxID=3162487 RepID=A0ABV3QAL7_9GAMM
MKKLLSTMRVALPLCLLGGTGIAHAMGGAAAGPDAGASRPGDANAEQGAAPAGRRAAVADFGKPVDDAGLDQVRGGFDLGDGLVASLGIQQVAYIDGNLVASTSIDIPNVAQITPQQALNLAAALGNLDLVIQNGSGNSVDPATTAQNAAATALAQGSPGGGITPSSTGTGSVEAAPVQAAPASTVSSSATMANAAPATSAAASGSTAPVSLLGLNAGLATVIQNSLNNQSIRTLTTLDVSVNTMQILRNMNLQSTLQSAQLLSLGH